MNASYIHKLVNTFHNTETGFKSSFIDPNQAWDELNAEGQLKEDKEYKRLTAIYKRLCSNAGCQCGRMIRVKTTG